IALDILTYSYKILTPMSTKGKVLCRCPSSRCTRQNCAASTIRPTQLGSSRRPSNSIAISWACRSSTRSRQRLGPGEGAARRLPSYLLRQRQWQSHRVLLLYRHQPAGSAEGTQGIHGDGQSHGLGGGNAR